MWGKFLRFCISVKIILPEVLPHFFQLPFLYGGLDSDKKYNVIWHVLRPQGDQVFNIDQDKDILRQIKIRSVTKKWNRRQIYYRANASHPLRTMTGILSWMGFINSLSSAVIIAGIYLLLIRWCPWFIKFGKPKRLSWFEMKIKRVFYLPQFLPLIEPISDNKTPSLFKCILEGRFFRYGFHSCIKHF